MKKAFMTLGILFLTLLLIILLRLSGGLFTERPLFPSYLSEEVTAVECPEWGWMLKREEPSWIFETDGLRLPAGEDGVLDILSFPNVLTRHLSLNLKGESPPPGDLPVQLIYRMERGGELTFHVQQAPENSSGGKGLFVWTGEGRGPVYYLSGAGDHLFRPDNLVETGVFSPYLESSDIVYYRLYTPKEGAEALMYRYELTLDDPVWSVKGEIPGGNLKDEAVHLLLLRLAGLKGAYIEERRESVGDSFRFRVELRDREGKQYILNVGDRIEKEGVEYYRASLKGGSVNYYMDRETLAGIAPPLNSLLEY